MFLGEIKMANIFINDLQAAGSGLFADTESFTDSIKDLSENELKMTFGGGKSKCSKSKSSKSKSSKSKSSKSGSSSHGGCGCGYGC
jgi:hypothetical protein